MSNDTTRDARQALAVAHARPRRQKAYGLVHRRRIRFLLGMCLLGFIFMPVSVFRAIAIERTVSGARTQQPCEFTPDMGKPSVEPARPNVVWIVLDACRAQNLSCYGYERETSPNIDAIAAEGAVFERHYAQDFWTFPAVPSYMTGRYFPAYCLDSGNWRDQTRVAPQHESLLPSILSENGYRTFLGTEHVMFSPFCRLWNAFDEAANEYTWSMLRQGIEDFLDAQDARPFFLYIHLMDTHFPHRLEAPCDKWVEPGYVSELVVDGGLPLPSDDPLSVQDRQLLQALYDGGILSGDSKVGEILNSLRARTLMEDTVLIIGSDHGETLGEDGKTVGHAVVCEEVMHVPLIMRGPQVRRGIRITHLTENVDIAPTLTGLLHLRTTARFDGADRSPVLLGRAEPAVSSRGYALAKHLPSAGAPQFVVRDDEYAYVYSPASGSGVLYEAPFSIQHLVECTDQLPDKAAAMREQVIEQLMPGWHAFNTLPEVSPMHAFTMKLASSFIQSANAVAFQPWETYSEHQQSPEDKWLSLSDGEILVGPSGSEAPALDVCLPVPNGTYRVKIKSSFDPNPLWPVPVRLFQVKMQEERDYRRVTVSPRDLTAYLGEEEVKDGMLRLSLSPCSPRRAFALGRLMLEPVGAAVPANTAEQLFERQEQLHALGYF